MTTTLKVWNKAGKLIAKHIIKGSCEVGEGDYWNIDENAEPHVLVVNIKNKFTEYHHCSWSVETSFGKGEKARG